MAAYPGPETFAGKLRDLERRLSALEGGTRAGRTAIRNGLLVILNEDDEVAISIGKQDDGTVNLRVYDPATGIAQISVGELADGSFGLEQIDPSTGDTVPLSAIALGNKSDYNFGPFTTSTPALTDMGGPSVTVTVPSTGRVNILASATADLDPGVTLAQIGVQVDGAGASHAIARGDNTDPDAGVEARMLTSVDRLTGLSPGAHTFKVLHGSTAGSTSFYRNTLIVTPY